MSNSSVKLSEEGKEFLNNFGRNRIKADTDKKVLSYADLLDVVVKYFKSSNERYLELVNMESGKNV